jgi:LMBR1 domain-containing protein 1
MSKIPLFTESDPHYTGLYLIVFVTSLLRSPKLDERQLDEDAEEAEEEGLLANTGRRFNASWQDITGRAARSELSHS